jgi:hypothetical protein
MFPVREYNSLPLSQLVRIAGLIPESARWRANQDYRKRSPNGLGSSLHYPAYDIASEECADERTDLEYRADVIECRWDGEEH